ncbi:MAG: YARHG domain-containing protein [Fimbriimonadales bacterium]|nr:YARHG domain-containing protein [Fimbriimonadales bacterium]
MKSLCVFLMALAISVVGCSREAKTNATKPDLPAVERDWSGWNLNTAALDPNKLDGLSLHELRTMRAWIFGKKGRVMEDEELQAYLLKQSWYKPYEDFTFFMLGPVEIGNLDLIREAESKAHKFIELGDLRFWADRTFSIEQLGKKSLEELRLLQAEMYAIHGGGFASDPQKAEYFRQRYWYALNQTRDWTDADIANLATLREAERRLRGVGVLPGELDRFQDVPLTSNDLEGLSLLELRLLRNEIYARKGRDFRVAWLSAHFWDQPWYSGGGGTKDPPLNDIESKSLSAVLQAEERLRQSVSNRVIDERILHGMFLEEADKLINEIYARHGKVFSDKWLQSYFESQSWYKRNPRFSESQLSDVEKENIRLLAEHKESAANEWRDFHG